MSELQREFEAWCDKQGLSTCIYGGRYLFVRTFDTWQGWCRGAPPPPLVPHQDQELLQALRVVRAAIPRFKENPKAETFTAAVEKLVRAAEGLV